MAAISGQWCLSPEYNGATCPMVNGNVTFPDCTVYVEGRGAACAAAYHWRWYWDCRGGTTR